MATQSCAPAQGRSSSAELSSVLHIGCTDRQRERGGGDTSKWPMRSTTVTSWSDSGLHTHTHTFFNKETNKEEPLALGLVSSFAS